MVSKERIKSGGYWFSLLLVLGRGILAVAMGAFLFFQPGRSGTLLGSFIGAYWMAAGMISLGAGRNRAKGRRLTLLVGVIGIAAGLTVQTRLIWDDLVTVELFSDLLGVVAVLTGLLHITGHIPVWREKPGQRSGSGYLLGAFEIGLGLILIFSYLESPLVRLALIVWAIGGGLLLVLQGVAMFRERLYDLDPDQTTEPE